MDWGLQMGVLKSRESLARWHQAGPLRISLLCIALAASFLFSPGLATHASAATITDNVSFDCLSQPLGSSLVNIVDAGSLFGSIQIDHVIQLNQFDPTLGTLTDVTFNLVSILETPQAPTFDLQMFLVGFTAPLLTCRPCPRLRQ